MVSKQDQQSQWSLDSTTPTINSTGTCTSLIPLMQSWQDLLFIESTMPFAACSVVVGAYIIGRLIFVRSVKRRAVGPLNGLDLYYIVLAINALIIGGVGTSTFVYTSLAHKSGCSVNALQYCKVHQTIFLWLSTFAGLVLVLLAWQACWLTYLMRWRSRRIRVMSLISRSKSPGTSVSSAVITVAGALIVSGICTMLPLHFGELVEQQFTSNDTKLDSGFISHFESSCTEGILRLSWPGALALTVAVAITVVVVSVLTVALCILRISLKRHSSRLAVECERSAIMVSEQLGRRLQNTLGTTSSSQPQAIHRATARNVVVPSAPAAEDLVCATNESTANSERENSGTVMNYAHPVSAVNLPQQLISAQSSRSSSLQLTSSLASGTLTISRGAAAMQLVQLIVPVPWLLSVFLVTSVPRLVTIALVLQRRWLQSDQTPLEQESRFEQCAASYSEALKWTTAVWLVNQALTVVIITFKYPILNKTVDGTNAAGPAGSFGSMRAPAVSSGLRQPPWISNSNQNIHTQASYVNESSSSSNSSDTNSTIQVPEVTNHGSRATGWKRLAQLPKADPLRLASSTQNSVRLD